MRALDVEPSGAAGVLLTEQVDAEAGEPFAQLAGLVHRLVERRGCVPQAVGVGATGPVDPVTGTVANPYTLPPCLQGDLRGELQQATGVPVVLENDADAAATGEAWLGAGRGAHVVVCVTVGTGIGTSVVRFGELDRGASSSHPEAGHLVIDPMGPSCYCGASGCAESLASATAVAAAARNSGAVPPHAAARDVHEAAAAGNRECRAIVDRARSSLALLVRNLVAVHGADRVVLAGGGLGDPGPLVQQVQAAVDAFRLGPPGGTVVAVAELGPAAGCIGAARLAMHP